MNKAIIEYGKSGALVGDLENYHTGGYRNEFSQIEEITCPKIIGNSGTLKYPKIKDYVLGLLTEEAGEISQVVGKIFRFGFDKQNENNLHDECGDMLAAIEYAVKKGILEEKKIYERMNWKLNKLGDIAP